MFTPPFHKPAGILQGQTVIMSRILLGMLLMLSGVVQAQDSRQTVAARSDVGETDGTGEKVAGEKVADEKVADEKVADEKAAADGDGQQKDSKPAAEDLLAESIEHNWKQFSSKENVALGDVWKIVEVENERYLKCAGEPKGFLYTKKKFSDFELTLEWKYTSDQNGNSGVLVYMQEELRLWPVSMQVQLHQPKAGSVFPSDGAKGTSSDVASLANEVGKWNTCRIVSQGGRLSVQINGKNAAEVAGCDPAKGYIAIQCEGSETVFRRLRVRDLSPVAEVVTEDSRAHRAEKTESPVPGFRATESSQPAQTSDRTSE